MTFNSMLFAAFLPTVVVLHWLLPHRLRLPLIVLASYIFYGAWDWRFLGLLWMSTAVDFAVARAIEDTDSDNQQRRRRLLAISVAVNLWALGFFKYFGFFADSAVKLLNSLGVQANPTTLKILLPVGISFYTFQTLGYTIDVYRRRSPACRSLTLFAAYVAYFPQLVAGPIERAERLLPQLAAHRDPPRSEQIESAIGLILLGLVKKVVLADQIAPFVNSVYSDVNAASGTALALAAVGFAIQIYGDFSGYSDIARGSSRLLNIELIDNFREPFLARDYTDLWRRWHVSLTTWLRDYVYVPLGGSRRSASRVRRNIMIVWLVTGLWHGAGWMFVAWGAANGVVLLTHRWWKRHSTGALARLPATMRHIVGATFSTGLFAAIAIAFRSPDLTTTVTALKRIATGAAGTIPEWGPQSVALITVATIGVDLARQRQRGRPRGRIPPLLRGAVAGAALIAIVLSSGDTPQPFIYFQF